MSALVSEALNQLNAVEEVGQAQTNPADRFSGRISQVKGQYARVLYSSRQKTDLDENYTSRGVSNGAVAITSAGGPGGNLPKGTRDTFNAIAEWEGTVTSVAPDTFIATLTQLPRGGLSPHPGRKLYTVGATDETELPIDDVPPADRELVVPGAIFRMVIGYQVAASGQRRRSVSVVFRRLPKWRRSDLSRAEATAAEEQSVFSSVTKAPDLR